MMKNRIITCLLALLLLFSIPVQQANAALAFKDVGETYSKVINEFVDLGIVGGYEDQTFRPNNNVTRGQAAIMLARALKLDTNNVGDVQYKDIDKDYPAFKEIAAVTKAGIMSGNKNKFEPNKPLTRAQMATILTKAFELKGKGSSSFKDVPKDHYAYSVIDALYSNEITTGYENDTFRPTKPVTRAHFVLFLSRALNNGEQGSTDEVTELLKEVYANEQNLNSYEFEGSFNLGLLLPESTETLPEMAAMFEMLKDVQIDVTGAYQKDPMQLEANINLTLKGDIQTTFTMPMVMTQDKMWIKLPQSPLIPIPEEVQGKFIEYDLAELAELSGQPLSTVDMELQTKLGIDIINLFVELLGKDFYEEVDLSTVTIPEGVNADKVIKFELTNESLKPFIDIVLNDLLPEFFELLEKPEYAEALGLTAEDIALAKESLATEEINIDEIGSEINKFLKINQLDEIIVISKDNYISYDVGTVDVTVTVDNEAFNLKLKYDQSKSNVNKDINFKIGIPKGENVIPYEKLLELEEAAFSENGL